MQTFIELWSFKSAWTDLGPEDRAGYMARIGPQIEGVTRAGVQLLACGQVERDRERAREWDMFAVWSVPDGDTLELFERAVADSGWYDYFEQVNVSGTTTGLEQLIGAMVSLPAVAR